jgi:hypothetical protein
MLLEQEVVSEIYAPHRWIALPRPLARILALPVNQVLAANALRRQIVLWCCRKPRGPLPLGETAGTRAAHVAADARLEEACALRRTLGTGLTGSRSSPVC